MPLEPSRSLRVNIRRKRVADLYLQGWTQSAIAAEVGVKQPTVCTDLKKIQADWKESAVRDFDLRREIELQKIDRVEREAWAAWERSQKPSQSAYTTDEANQRHTRRHVKNSNGDPRFLEIVHKCIGARRELLGLDAPTRMEIETDGPTLDERRDRLIAVAAALGHRAGIGASGAGPVVAESGQLCADRQRGEVDPSAPPRLPGPGDCRVD